MGQLEDLQAKGFGSHGGRQHVVDHDITPLKKRVLVSDGERVVMEIDLATALEKLFGKSGAVRTTETIVEDRSQEDLIKEAGAYYDSILDAMDKGDWIVFGENFDKLGETLGSLER